MFLTGSQCVFYFAVFWALAFWIPGLPLYLHYITLEHIFYTAVILSYHYNIVNDFCHCTRKTGISHNIFLLESSQPNSDIEKAPLYPHACLQQLVTCTMETKHVPVIIQPDHKTEL